MFKEQAARRSRAQEQVAEPAVAEKEAASPAPAGTVPQAENGTGIAGALSNHKGKLAVGAAAMLGLAVFYKWRENKLAKDDPEEYARLRRLKAAVDSGNGGSDT